MKFKSFLLLMFFVLSLCLTSCSPEKPYDNNKIAKIVTDYEQQMNEEIELQNSENPQYTFSYNPVVSVSCTYIFTYKNSLEKFLEKYDLKNEFINSIKQVTDQTMITITFERDSFTEGIHKKLEDLRTKETSISKLSISMNTLYWKKYVPKIEYFI